MTAAARRPLRTVVCGTGFGRHYVEAVRALDGEFELVGILARGGDYSRGYARAQGVPLYTSVADLPDGVDVACVVVGAAVSGGPGSELARALLERGVHVIQEHPVHHDELARTLRAARAAGRVYHLNPFYRNVGPVTRFLQAAEALRGHGRALFVDAASAIQVLYPLLDVLGRALGGLRPWAFADPHPQEEAVAALAHLPQPYRVLQGVVGGVPLVLRVQNQLDPADGDNHALLWHRLAIGAEGGVLTLADTHGPVLWSPRLHVPRDAHRRLTATGPGTGHLDEPSTTVLDGTAPRPFRDVFGRTWPEAVARALRELAADIAAHADPLARGQYDLAVCRVWHDVTARLGRPEIIRPAPPRPLRAADVCAPSPTAPSAQTGPR
ncbi:Gfo/Idh/MocA family oxidoreductase [Thermobifida halotolerans]|uniref:Gfo/Idh/MocA family oxidoreductase n=1 Tax=Thermobifida halotolerans TaxID=483545 RepID=A0AA97M557_9ACTN|nr:Gfo/Idh/MocA family oxidoreductase [Thermobifida halotolerans]UOE20657.1 Gfo/Idh/MocA family oxidoreductase [Thermobifida halotolerans]